MTTLSIADVIGSQTWAINPEHINEIVSTIEQKLDSVESVEAIKGNSLNYTRTVIKRGNVAVIPIRGAILRYDNIFSKLLGLTSLEVLAVDFKRALNDSSIKSIVLNIDSPGGMAAGVAEFAQVVNESTKHVVAYVDDYAASAAYWIACAADEIAISKTGQVGSIGAVMGVNARKNDNYMEIVSTQSPKKRPDLSKPEGMAIVQKRIDATAQVFIEDVATYRRVTVRKVIDDFGQGDIRLGKDAVKIGMADRVTSLEKVISDLSSEKSYKRTPPKRIVVKAKSPADIAAEARILMSKAEEDGKVLDCIDAVKIASKQYN